MNKTKIAAAFDKPASDPKNNFASASEEPEFGPKKEPEVKPLVRLPVGVDLAKKYIQVCFKDPVTGKIINKQLTRAQFAKFLAGSKYGPMMVGMEACGTCTYWGHFCLDHGHIPVILPAQLVHANNTGNKDDANDARCIWRLLFLPDIETKKIRLRSTDNQDLMSMMKLQESLAKIETQIENIVRHYLLERGVTSNKGAESVMNSLKKYCEDTIEVLGLENERSAMLSVVSSSFCGLMKANISSEQAITDYIISWAASNEKCKLLMTIPYVGPIAAAAIAIYMEDPSYFKNGRQFTALCRMVPYHTGTGGKVEFLGIHRNGCSWIKRILFEVSMGMYMRVMKALKEGQNAADGKVPEPLSEWIVNMAKRKPIKKVVCAIAGKLCRISWAVLSSGTPYEQSKSSLIQPSVASPEGKVKSCRTVRKSNFNGVMSSIEAVESFWAAINDEAQQAA